MLAFLLFVVAGLTITLAILLALFLHFRGPRSVAPAAATTDSRAADFSPGGDFGPSNSVTILLGDREVAHGLMHVDDQRDGVTDVETLDGVSARALRLQDGRTVTREAVKGEAWPVDFSTSNQVTLALGQEQPEDGLRHHPDEPDGRTQVENLDGAPCRLMRRENKSFGFLYFAISPSFKRERLSNARVDVEYFVKKRTYWRLQFDGVKDDAVHHYVSVVPEGAQVVKFTPTTEFARLPEVGSWGVATFHVTNAVFRNGQNGDADFRLEINPAEIYVRRVTVTREGGPTQPQPR